MDFPVPAAVFDLNGKAKLEVKNTGHSEGSGSDPRNLGV
jgi:hypothetical protein